MINIPRVRMVVAPQAGRVVESLPEATRVAKGDVVARLESARGTHELVAPWAGRVGGALADGRTPLDAGDGVLWLDVA